MRFQALLDKKNKQIERIWNDLTAVTEKYNALCKHFKSALHDHGIQLHGREISEVVPTDKREYFEGA